jgi:hypothetical protein
MMVFALFFTSCCFASLPIYCVQQNDDEENLRRGEKILAVSSPWKEIAHAIWRSPSSLAIHSARPSCSLNNPIIVPGYHRVKKKRETENTLL